MMTRDTVLRSAALAILASLLGVALVLLIVTPQGLALMHNPHLFGQDVRGWVARHPVESPGLLIVAYLLCTLVALPVWWLQVLAGYGFGLIFGMGWCILASGIAAVATAELGQWLAAGAVQVRVNQRMARLRRLQQNLGHNGLLVVMAVRLTHVVPFGLSNYAFGALRVHPASVFVGTLIGMMPITATYVGLGAAGEFGSHWIFIGVLIGLNLMVLALVALRYKRPGWFGRFGVE